MNEFSFIKLGYHRKAISKSIQNHNTNCINLQYSCLLCQGTRDQAFNHIEKHASGKQPDIYFKNSALFYSTHNIQLHSKGVSIQSHPVDNINSLCQNQQLLSATCYYELKNLLGHTGRIMHTLPEHFNSIVHVKYTHICMYIAPPLSCLEDATHFSLLYYMKITILLNISYFPVKAVFPCIKDLNWLLTVDNSVCIKNITSFINALLSWQILQVKIISHSTIYYL
jgi:hypothetical protein